MTCLHRELCAEGYVCMQVCEAWEGAGGSTGFGGKQRQRKYEREREREIGFPATATNGIPAAHETRRCPLYSSFPCPWDTNVRRCV
jgi:hypothetical protein